VLLQDLHVFIRSVPHAAMSFMKTLKREEIYANDYRDLDHLRANIEAFIEQYYNRFRLHSALGYKPQEFEQALESATASTGATMSFFRHGEDYRPRWCTFSSEERPEDRSSDHRFR